MPPIQPKPSTSTKRKIFERWLKRKTPEKWRTSFLLMKNLTLLDKFKILAMFLLASVLILYVVRDFVTIFEPSFKGTLEMIWVLLVLLFMSCYVFLLLFIRFGLWGVVFFTIILYFVEYRGQILTKITVKQTTIYALVCLFFYVSSLIFNQFGLTFWNVMDFFDRCTDWPKTIGLI